MTEERMSLEPYIYAAKCVEVIDGDTIDVLIDFGFKLRQEMRLRLADINTPELRSKDETEREKAQLAKEYVQALLLNKKADSLGPAAELRLKMRKTRKGEERRTFGRYVAEVYFLNDDNEWDDLNALLVSMGHAEWSEG